MASVRVGDVVRIKGDPFDLTEHLDDSVALVRVVRARDCLVQLSSDPQDLWWVRRSNIVEVVGYG